MLADDSATLSNEQLRDRLTALADRARPPTTGKKEPGRPGWLERGFLSQLPQPAGVDHEP